MSRRIARARHDGVPVVAVIGDREVVGETLSIRGREGRWIAPVGDAIAELARRCRGDGSPARDAAAAPS